VVDEQANPGLMQAIIPAEEQGFSHQIGTALTQGIIEPFDMRGFARRLCTNSMPLPWQDRAIAVPIIGGTDGACAVVRGQ